MKFILLFLFVFITNTNACELRIREQITPGTYQKIEEVLERCKHDQIIVRADSDGGLANPLIKTMDKISRHGNVMWIVEPNGVCISACAWLAIASRSIKGKLYFHGITTEDGRLAVDNLQLQAWLYRRGIDLKTSSLLVGRDFIELEFK